MQKKMRLVFDCQIGKCPFNSDPDTDCFCVCDQCKLCDSRGMVITKVKRDDILYEVRFATDDEILIYALNNNRYYSISGLHFDKFAEEFEVAETEPDIRRHRYY